MVFLYNVTHADDYKNNKVISFINFMHKEHGYNKNELQSLFNEIKSESRLKKFFTRAPERMLTWNGCEKYDVTCTNYKKLFVTKSRIINGAKYWQRNQEILSNVQKKYGVPPEIIIAIIAIESKFGSQTGSFKTFDTLASLSLGPNKGRRSKFYKQELINFLLMCKENDFNPREIKGSYAGALGQPQFISSSYRNYAIDFDGDNRVDLWNTNADIIGSVANYFNKNGWVSNQPILSDIVFPESAESLVDSESLKTYKPKTPYKIFEQKNIKTKNEISKSTLLAIIGRKETFDKAYKFGHKNFYVITRYNRSRLYALAVYFLSQEIKNAKSKLDMSNI
jgi:membrane-bound lytic murein transglycosylase B